MKTIRVICHGCDAEVELAPGDVDLQLGIGTDAARYSFDCPACDSHADRPASPDVVALLASVGVVARPAPLPPSPPLTYDDLLDFHEAMAGRRYLAPRALEEMSR